MKGDWKKCNDLIMTLRIYNNYKSNTHIKQKLTENIKETGLKCYLIFYKNEYKSLNLSALANRFNLDENNVKRIINKMILEEDIRARWNNNALVMSPEDDNINVIKRLE